MTNETMTADRIPVDVAVGVLVKRDADRVLHRTQLFDTVAQRLSGFAEPTRFHF